MRVGLGESKGSAEKDTLSLNLKTVLEATVNKMGAYVKHTKTLLATRAKQSRKMSLSQGFGHKPGNSRLGEPMSSELFPP